MNKIKSDDKFSIILTIMGVICAISIISLAIIQLLGLFYKAIYIYEPLLGVLMIIQTIQNWSKNRNLALISLFSAIFIFIIATIIFFSDFFI